MYELALEPTNLCNRNCLHCIRNKADAPESISLDLVGNIFTQARALGINKVCLTGGEVAVYPHLEELIRLIEEFDFSFNLVTNGFKFAPRLLPLLAQPRIKKKLDAVCFSLDGADAETHDALRGKGSFKEVMEAATFCKLAGFPINLKSVITNFNKKQLTDLALLGASLGAESHSFLHLFPSPRLIEEGVIPSPEELRQIVLWIMGSLATTVRSKIGIEGCSAGGALFRCGNIYEVVNVDYQGNLILCCNLSHITGGNGIPTRFGDELLADLKEVSLKEGLIRHFKAAARLMEARLKDMDILAGVTYIPCYWCFKHFGKLDWLRNYPDSPWAAGVLN
jgi:MoaA/NifB/PqqE/SkfB family radical SAM enzyme